MDIVIATVTVTVMDTVTKYIPTLLLFKSKYSIAKP